MVFQYLVHDALQSEGLRDLDRGHGVPHVHLVGEEENGDLARPDVGVLWVSFSISVTVFQAFKMAIKLLSKLDSSKLMTNSSKPMDIFGGGGK